MKEFIEKIKKMNGNENLSQKDLIFYVIGKVDKLDDRISSHLTITNKQINLIRKELDIKIDGKINKKSFFTSMGILATFIIGLFSTFFKLMTNLINS